MGAFVSELGNCGTISVDSTYVQAYSVHMNTQTLVALYARVSTLTRGQDVENQLAQLREFAAKMGWTIAHEYIDHVSGGKSDRKAFQQLFTDASQRKFDVVLFWSLDRFSREGTLQTLQHLQRLTACNVAWKSYTESYLDSLGPFADVVVSLLATIAKQERTRIRERVAAGLARAAAKGRFPGRPKVQCDRDKVLALRAAGRSFGQIATEMNLAKASVARICAQCGREVTA
jgi:DNA invertase Pin-like site-specific DNA recombinase